MTSYNQVTTLLTVSSVVVLYRYDQLFWSRVTDPFEEKRFTKCHSSQDGLKSVTYYGKNSHALERLNLLNSGV